MFVRDLIMLAALAIALTVCAVHSSELTIGGVVSYSNAYYNDVSFRNSGLRLSLHDEKAGQIAKASYVHDFNDVFGFLRGEEDGINSRSLFEWGAGYGAYIYKTEALAIKPSLALLNNGELSYLSYRIKLKGLSHPLQWTNTINACPRLDKTEMWGSVGYKIKENISLSYSWDFLKEIGKEVGASSLGVQLKL